MEALAELIRENQPCVALTGAGVSTVNHVPRMVGATSDRVRDADEPC